MSMKGWRDHTFYGIIIFLTIGATATCALYEYVLIPLRINTLVQDNKELSDMVAGHKNKITKLNNALKVGSEHQSSGCKSELITINAKSKRITELNDTNSKILIESKKSLDECQSTIGKLTNKFSNKIRQPIASNNIDGNKSNTSTSRPKIAYIDGTKLVLKRCALSNESVTCTIIITSTVDNISLTLDSRRGSDSRIIDNNGNQYNSGVMSLGNGKKEILPRTNLVSGIPIQAKMYFSGIPNDISSYSLLELETNHGRARFKNINVDQKY